MDYLPALLPNAIPLTRKFFAEMSTKRQRCAVVNLQNNFSISTKSTDVYCNCKQQLSENIYVVHTRVLPWQIKH
jgi:hypothetical protein